MPCKRFSHLIHLFAIVALSFVSVGCGDGDGPTPVVDPTPPASEVYTLVWADEFDVDGPPNVQNWRMETGYGDNGWGNNEWQLYTDDTSSPNNNVRVENGNLVITARCSVADTDPARCNTASDDPDESAVRTGIITSARINSKDKFEIKYGNIQARIKTPPGKGMWPAFWSLGSVFPDTPWPRAGEIDFMEMHQFFSNDRTTHFTVHWCDDSKTAPDQCELDPGWTFDSRFKTFDEVLTDDYHIFEAEWDENRIVGKIDGITYFSRPIDWTTEEEFLKSFFMILNVAVGGTLGGPPNDSTTWPQEMLVDWVRVYERKKPDVVELVPDDRTTPLPFVRIVNSVEFGGDSVVSTIQRTVSEDDDDFDKITPPAVTPLTGNTVVEFDYQSANTFFSGAAFLFRLKDLTHYEKLVFSLDTSVFPDFADISIEIQDDRFKGEGDPGITSLPLSNYTPTAVPGTNWRTYEIPLTDFNLTNLDNVASFGFWNPKNAGDQLIAGKLYLDDIKFVNVECTANGDVSFGSDTVAGNTGFTQITVTDSCLANKNKNVVVVVDNGTDAIGVSVPIGASGLGTAMVNFGPTNDASGTIAIQEGYELTATYKDANGEIRVDAAIISTPPLAVYSETGIENVITYDGISNLDTVTDEANEDVTALEGSFSLRADYSVPAGSENGFAFNFPDKTGGLLVNGGFELPDASGGDFGIFPCDGIGSIGAPGWDTFNCNFIVNTASVNPVPLPHSGSQVLKQFGVDPGARQSVDVNAGDTVVASAYALNYETDPFNDLAILQLSFFNANPELDEFGNPIPIGGAQVLARPDGSVDYQLEQKPGTAVTDWTQMQVSAVAPEDTVRAEVLVLQADVQTGGVIFWDDISLTIAPQTLSSNDISYYQTLKLGINTGAAGNFEDLEVRMQDAASNVASVFLSDFTPTPGAVSGWDVYEIPLPDFAGLDKTDIRALGFYNASSTVSAPPSGSVTHFAGTLYFDDVHFAVGEPLTGVLVNAPIEGVTFVTNTQSGITNTMGEFQYFPGELITFYVGGINGIELGTFRGAPIITPVELTGSFNPADQTATNQLVFMQSIDQDQDYSTGITISAATQAAAEGLSLDFTLASAEFTDAVTAVVDAIAPGNTVVSELDAVENFYQTFPPTGSGATTTISAVPGTVDADGASLSTINVKAKDSSGNNITVSAGTVTLSSSSANAIISTVIDNSDGTYTATVLNAVPETVTISGTIAANTITDDATVIFTGPVSGAQTTIEAAPTSVEADGITTSTITVQAKDANGNDFVASAGTVVLTATSTSAVLGAVTDNQDGTYTATVSNDVAEVVTITGTIAAEVITDDATVSFVVGAVNPATTTIDAVPASVVNDGIAFSTLTVQAKDSSGNNIAESVGDVTLSSPSSSAVISPVVDNGDGTYTATVSNTVLELVTITGTIAGSNIADDANVTFGPPVGVYSETNTATVLAYSEIINTAAGCKLTPTAEVGSGVQTPLEGANSLQADYPDSGVGGNCNGFVFSFGAPGSAALTDYTQDFEALLISDADALGNDGYSVFGTVWDDFVGGTISYPYGPFPAPNGTGGFSEIATGEGSPSQGDQYINIFSDYNNLDHANGKIIDTVVFQEQTIAAGDIADGNIYTFSFDYKAPFTGGIAPPSTANAFIKTLDPDAGFAQTNLVMVDMSTPDNTTWNRASVSFEISNPLLAGQIIQFGWNTVATNYNDSGVFYDNLSFSNPPGDISGYATLKFAIDSSSVPALADLEVRMEDTNAGVASVFLSDYTAIAGNVAGASWDLYEIPLSDFSGTLDKTIVKSLGFYNASSTVTGSTAVPPTLLAGTLYFDDIHFVEAATVGVYSETSVSPVLAYSEIINAADFGGNVTNTNELSTAVSPLDGSFVLQALFLNSSQAFGGFVFNFDTVRPAVNGQDISAYTTLKFGIDTSGIPNFADLVVQLEDGNVVSKVLLSDYTQTVTVSNNWDIYAIPLSAFSGLDLTNLTYLGFWNASSVAGAESPLVFGPLYFDDIHFKK